MKKILPKPENWQDFETLCKKLWGEIWNIPNKIKKNGRLGQKQAGVDVYGIPKNESKYWGIQSKGKDDYSNAKLTIKEINSEIEKAKSFKPELDVYIIATTANKSASIEEHIRIIDLENREKGLFEILLFCWEDIVDLIEENQNVLNWYQNGIGLRTKFELSVLFNDFQEKLVLRPKIEKKIQRFKLTNKTDKEIVQDIIDLSKKTFDFDIPTPTLFNYNGPYNKSWCDFKLIMKNTGSVVLEDWHFIIKFVKGVSRLDDGSTSILPKISFTEYVDDTKKEITYNNNHNTPLIQQDFRSFKISLLPEPNTKEIITECKILARDYNFTKKIKIFIEPQFIEKIDFIEVNKKEYLKEDEISYSYYIS